MNPVLAYAIACIGAALGLRCTVRALALPARQRRGWLLLAAAAIGSGIWTMHFIAMLGFSVTGATIVYDVGLHDRAPRGATRMRGGAGGISSTPPA